MIFPKTTPQRNPHLLAMAQGKPCMMRVKCNGEASDTTVAAHSNSQTHGKGIGRKADDQYTVWSCARCHTWLDQSYSATGEERQAAWEAAHVRQIAEWRKIAESNDFTPYKDRVAALWALERV
jgi:hypothetical protein